MESNFKDHQFEHFFADIVKSQIRAYLNLLLTRKTFFVTTARIM